MGNYATTTGLQISMIGVKFDTATTNLATKCIDQAEPVINSYLGKRFDLSAATFQTYTSCPPMVRTLAERLAMGYMWPYISRGSKESLSRGKEIEKSVKDELKEISESKIDLFDTAGSIIPDMSNTSARVLCNTKNYTPTFGEDDELNWAVDPDKLEDAFSDRS